MANRREMARKGTWVRELIDENKYIEALELIDRMPLNEVESVEDLYLFADLYEKAERLDKKKEIYYIVYERNHSRHVLNRLLRLVLRMGDMEEARELFLAYEMSGDATLDTYELRYLIARAEGASRTVLIDILEELKREEYTEEWGYQLARLYEQEGMREKCIQECKDLKLWFGEGRIVDKAEELRTRCEAEDWEPPKDVEIPEPEVPEPEEIRAYAAAPVTVTELETEDTESGDRETEPDEPGIAEAEIVESESVESVAALETEQLEVPEETEEEEMLEVPESQGGQVETLEAELPVREEMQPLEVEMPVRKENHTLETEMPVIHAAPPFSGEGVSEPVVVKKKKPIEPVRHPVESLEELLEEEPEDISEHGISYRTLKGTINRLKKNSGAAHFVFAGGEERITLAVAKRLTKELNNRGHLSAGSIMKITADKLNQLELAEQTDKLLGGCMLITDAPELSEKSVRALLDCMEQHGERIVIMLSGAFDEMDCFLGIYPELSDKLEYKVRM